MTPERLALWDARAREADHPPAWRLTDQEREAARCATLEQHNPKSDLCVVFAYGSLMWDPTICFAEVRLARVEGYQRLFGYRLTSGRGSLQCPALMLTLAPQPGHCTGLAFRVPSTMIKAETTMLWRREMICGGYAPRWETVATPQGDVPALVFAANRAHPEYVGDLPIKDTAALMASAQGPLGSNRAYLESLAAQLSTLGIDDRYIQQLQQAVQSHPR